jgi:hypothetical protein
MRLRFACRLPATSVVMAALLIALLPSRALAQAGGIAGQVKDTTGAVLPGVSVEASSPALIEKVRTVVTDNQGLYNIVDLRPGSYVVTFTLAGFATVKREGIELTASFTATVNAELRVGGVAETITVSGEAPTVDVQNTVKQTVMTRTVIDALPTGTNSWQNVGVLIPGTTAQSQDVGGTGAVFANIAAHGGRLNDILMMSDGMSTSLGAARFQNGPRLNNTAAMQEFALAIGAFSAETVGGGVRMDAIPKDGGNNFSGAFYAAFTNYSLQSDNLTDELMTRGLTTVDRVEKIFDINPGAGGPILRDRLWFFAAYKRAGNYQRVAGIFANMSTNPYAYVPDPTRPAVDRQEDGGRSLRLTSQLTPKNKLTFFYWDTRGPNDAWYSAGGAARLTAPEAISRRVLEPYYADQLKWSAPVTNHVLVEAGATFVNGDFQVFTQPGVALETPSLTELRTGIVWGNFSNTFGHNASHQFNERFALSYVTGSHSLKTGVQLDHSSTYATQNVTGNSMTLQLLDGAPSRVTVFATPLEFRESTNGNFGLFAQDQWRVNRFTVNFGARFDHINSFVPAITEPAGRFVPLRDFPAVYDVPNMNDFSPRAGVVWDMFGDSKTALKLNIGKYLEDTSLSGITRSNSPASASVTNATRPWIDANRDFIPQDSELGALSNSNFGKSVVTTHYDPQALTTRFQNWEFEATLQRELTRQVSITGGYFRRWYRNFTITDNQLTTPGDFDPYCITAPLDSRLPGGGGYQVCGLYDVKPALNGQFNNVVTLARNFGTRSEVYDGVDVDMNARLGHGIVVSGGTSVGRTKTNSCVVVDSPQAENPLVCLSEPPFQPQVKLLGIYPMPWWGLQLSTTFQSLPGPAILANYTATNAEIRGTLGRNLAAGANATAVVPLVQPGTLFGDRLNQLDFRLAKIFRISRTRLQAQVELFNMFNGSPALLVNNNYSAGPAGWQRPTQINQGRLVKFGMQLQF